VVIACIGLGLLVSGHFHKEDGETESRLKRNGRFALFGGVFALAIIGIPWAIKKSYKPEKPIPVQATTEAIEGQRTAVSSPKGGLCSKETDNLQDCSDQQIIDGLTRLSQLAMKTRLDRERDSSGRPQSLILGIWIMRDEGFARNASKTPFSTDKRRLEE
jgi:hypothetical protein